jgi:hypothetical protein
VDVSRYFGSNAASIFRVNIIKEIRCSGYIEFGLIQSRREEQRASVSACMVSGQDKVVIMATFPLSHLLLTLLADNFFL